MKTICLAVGVSIFALSGLSLASQASGQKTPFPRMNDGKHREPKGGMMRMVKMMDQCAVTESPSSGISNENMRDMMKDMMRR